MGISYTNPSSFDLLPDGWDIAPIGDVCSKVTSGGTPLRSRSEYYINGAISWFRTQELKDGFLEDSELRITELALRESSAKMLPENTILMAMYGDGKTITSLGILRKPATCNQACCAMIAKPIKCDYRFLFYSLKHHRNDFMLIASGGAQRNLSGTLIRNFAIRLPPLSEQRAIANILGTLDDKIELNRRMNETLEAMARALFKSWFVNFDPVRRNIARHTAPIPPSPVISDEIDALFPDAFEVSELGEIPKGWKVKTIGDLANVVGGSTPSTKEPTYWEGGTNRWATPKDLSRLSVPVLLETERCITNVGLSQIGSGLLPIGTVLLSSRAPIGYLAVAEIPVAINQGFIAMTPRKCISNLFLLMWARIAHETILSRANGSTFLEISKSNFRPIPIVVPPEDVMQAFDNKSRPLYQRIVACERESRTLTALRDSLLPKLLSGEIRVDDLKYHIAEN